MYKGIYIVASGAVLKDSELGVIARNLSNANTSGFKKDFVTFKSYPLPSSNPATGALDERTMADVGRMASDFSSGNLLKTGNDLDVAIDGSGFIALEGNRFTRRGDFRISEEGYLVNQDGLKVMGEGDQPIQIPEGKVVITPEGEIFADNASVGTLKAVKFDASASMEKTADSIYTTAAQPSEAGPSIRQGYLESSNVDTIREMVRMISTVREFEIFQKMIQAYDEATSKASNEIARI
jgi:flagellar basal-body rod protein FlgG